MEARWRRAQASWQVQQLLHMLLSLRRQSAVVKFIVPKWIWHNDAPQHTLPHQVCSHSKDMRFAGICWRNRGLEAVGSTQWVKRFKLEKVKFEPEFQVLITHQCIQNNCMKSFFRSSYFLAVACFIFSDSGFSLFTASDLSFSVSDFWLGLA